MDTLFRLRQRHIQTGNAEVIIRQNGQEFYDEHTNENENAHQKH